MSRYPICPAKFFPKYKKNDLKACQLFPPCLTEHSMNDMFGEVFISDTLTPKQYIFTYTFRY